MKNRIESWRIAFLAIFMFLVLPPAADAALPFTVKSGHPRVYLDQATLDAIRASYQAPIALNDSAFPQDAGTLTLDIRPMAKPSGSLDVNQVIFDGFDGARNHIFIRHSDEEVVLNKGTPDEVRTGKTYCGTYITDTENLCMQAALQGANLTYYIASYNFKLIANQWQTIRISWSTVSGTAFLQIDNAAQIDMGWRKNNGVPVMWRPDKQKFLLRGRDQADNARVYSSEVHQASNLVADFGMEEGRGNITTDSSASKYRLRIKSGNTWVAGQGGGYALQLAGNAGVSVIAENVITDAWADFYTSALNNASKLNSGAVPANLPCSLSNRQVPSNWPADVWCGHPNSILNVSRNLGLSYLVTGDARFLSAAQIYADLLVSVPRDSGGDYSQAGRIEAMGIIYDWFFSNLSVAQKAELSGAIMDTIKFQETSICGSGKTITQDPAGWYCNGPVTPDFIGGHSHQNNTETTVGLLAIIDEHHELDNILEVEYNNFVTGYNPARAWISVDGGHHMGWAYGAAYTFLDSIQLWKTATNAASMKDDWQGMLINRYIYALRGDVASFPVSGDGFSLAPSNEFVTSFALWGSRFHDNRIAQRFYNQWSLPLKSGNRFYELLYWKPDLVESPIAQQDLSKWFHNAGQVLMRDSWDYPNATLLEFKSTSFMSVNHHHLDQNAFTLFYKAPLLIDSGYYGGLDEYGSDHWQNYYTRTIAHNTITVFNPGEKFARTMSKDYCNDGPSSVLCSNDGGQRFPGQRSPSVANPALADIMPNGANHLDGVTAYEYLPELTYVVGNASKAYDPDKLDQNSGFLRSMVFLRAPGFWGKPVTVVFDKVTESSGSTGPFVKRFLMHSVNEPLSFVGEGLVGATAGSPLSGNTAVIQNGSGMLFAQTLLPEGAVLTKAGGKNAVADYRFMVPRCANNTCATDSDYQLKNYGLMTSDAEVAKNPDVGAWRIEVTAPVPSRREYFLHVLSVADNGAVSTPPGARNLSSPSTAAALLNNTHTIAFSKSDGPAASLSWNTPVVDSKIVAAGLQPNTAYAGSIATNGSGVGPYTVTFNQDQNGKFLASSQGVLTVNSSLGELGADLAIALSATPNPVYQGSNITYSATVTNNGPSAASAVTVSGLTGCTLSSNTLPSGGMASCTASVAATTVGTTSQTVSVSGAEVDPNTHNNTASTITTVVAPDLIPTVMSASKSGSRVYVSDTVTNQGNANAGSFGVTYYLSTNTTYEPADLPLVSTSGGSTACSRTVTSLAMGVVSSVSSKTCYKPASAVTGTRYYVLAVDDLSNQVIESNETNNTRSSTGQVRW